MLGEETNYTNRESWKHTVIYLCFIWFLFSCTTSIKTALEVHCTSLCIVDSHQKAQASDAATTRPLMVLPVWPVVCGKVGLHTMSCPIIFNSNTIELLVIGSWTYSVLTSLQCRQKDKESEYKEKTNKRHFLEC